MVGFSSIASWCYSGWWVWDSRTLAHFQGSDMSPGLFPDLMDWLWNFKTLPIVSWTVSSQSGILQSTGSQSTIIIAGFQLRGIQFESYG